MYLHIVPNLFHLMANECRLESITIPEFDFKIEVDALSTGRPWPNRNVWVGMRKGRKAINGLLLNTDKKIKWFTTEYQWNIESMGTQDILLNNGFDEWECRVHSAYENKAPVQIQPKMESFITKPDKESHDVWIEYNWGDFLVSREESLLLHTIQSERLNTDFSLFSRFPSFKQVINI
ncbi:hypothetical protein RNE10_004667 [Salmonella enterica]|uniref:Uncharacterized protein n=1 Tax=Salmonella enterica TaxID=28901 RepID=A0A7U6H224_SALER|nr:DUF6012 family protein [Salmonella enterica]EBO5292952.1 hypothetical protein [Salmonella enterica subsp. enterica serovar Typhimurium]EDU1826582.1 hypothetical protein [Salmonella enterica subsp. enterica serovar Fluntern]AXD74810.1 hypothetical protein CHC34_28875 [Salmonella enterica]EIK6010596.1 hypothetical protein [Salmonella enterica]ELF3518997.1 hypothetical protein [Salmonella enterica]